MTKPSKLRRPSTWAAIVAGGGLYTRYYLRNVAKAPELSYQRNEYNDEVIRQCPSLRNVYYPTPFITGPHEQTCVSLAAKGFGILPLLNFEREMLLTPDGGSIALDWLPKPGGSNDKLPPNTPIMIVLHGFTGGRGEPCIRLLLKAATDRGWRALLLNSRGCSGAPLTSSQPYCASFTGDMHQVVGELKTRLPHAPLMAVGMSMGAVILTKYVAEADSAQGSGLVAAFSGSNPLDFADSQAKMETNFALACYMSCLSVRMAHYFWMHFDSIIQHPKVNVTRREVLLHCFDNKWMEEKVLVPIYGFRDRQQ
ncbi:hypothetical protein CYMTET_17875 [Cymbomonas tetramitiformis]|uniref:AB hydrolase-1 domain-containing protein n=1 Tax=Cymbomonas tetramitiformis TaxID=36881 RepID=A0AAE0G971_9CHLO|nr:hypothetical protein CYMTET_17875 [Cymbomonas tetramitiformis]